MSRKFIYIINPVSGTGNKARLRKHIEKGMAASGFSFEIHPSLSNGDYSYLKKTIKEKGITDVVIAGGDGTVSQVVSSLMGEKVNFGIIPVGSGNGLALSAGISRQVSRALHTILNGPAVLVDGFLVNDRFACMLAGLGFDAEVARGFADKPRRGLMTYIRLTLKKFFSMTPYHFLIELHNQTIDTEAFFISIANSNQFGNNFTIAPAASLSDGLLDVVIVTRQHKVNMILQTLKQVAGWNKPGTASLVREKKGVIYFQTKEIRIQNLGGAPLHIDGEPSDTEKVVSVSVIEKCYRLIQPA